LNADNIGRDPVRRRSKSREASMDHNDISLSDDPTGFVS
jgi:hypothetical protein